MIHSKKAKKKKAKKKKAKPAKPSHSQALAYPDLAQEQRAVHRLVHALGRALSSLPRERGR